LVRKLGKLASLRETLLNRILEKVELEGAKWSGLTFYEHVKEPFSLSNYQLV
jgi:hypothetical protein